VRILLGASKLIASERSYNVESPAAIIGSCRSSRGIPGVYGARLSAGPGGGRFFGLPDWTDLQPEMKAQLSALSDGEMLLKPGERKTALLGFRGVPAGADQLEVVIARRMGSGSRSDAPLPAVGNEWDARRGVRVDWTVDGVSVMRETIRREFRVAFSRHGQPVWFRVAKWIVIVGLAVVFLAQAGFLGCVSGVFVAGLTVHLVIAGRPGGGRGRGEGGMIWKPGGGGDQGCEGRIGICDWGGWGWAGTPGGLGCGHSVSGAAYAAELLRSPAVRGPCLQRVLHPVGTHGDGPALPGGGGFSLLTPGGFILTAGVDWGMCVGRG